MDNNDIFRRLRYIFNFSDDQIIMIFGLADLVVSRAQISDWLKRDDDPTFRQLDDRQLATFLNGLITHKRGAKEGPKPIPEKRLNNNIVFRKLKIALNYKDTDILEIFKSVDLRIGKPELTAIFRNPKQKQYRVCKDQFLRNFLNGLQQKYRFKEV
jgi:uncharacterized protein YehS (DUF1456 family)